MLRAAEPVLTRLCARYLLIERGRGDPPRALDAVAHFHLFKRRQDRAHQPRSPTRPSGAFAMGSATVMVNYLYDPARIEDYHEDYAGEGRRNASTLVRRMARGWG